ncbi:MAG: squalene synthase HpnC [Bryobacteraceae bacterium]|nr:squalene synthase HpnC [Bryobacteraceae bacterium]
MTLSTYFLQPAQFLKNPEALSRPFTPDEGEAYTRWLATHHYENFHVVSLLLPRRLRQDFYNVYAFCRWADDLGDEIGDPAESERLLRWWDSELALLYQGRATHPVFAALARTNQRHGLPIEPFRDLIQAFLQDQKVTRYSTRSELLAYCRYSANPVGRLVLALCGYRDPERQRLSDATCTALQLANFWQDVSVDLEKGRVYIPLEDLERHDCPLEDVLARRPTPAFRRTMTSLVAWARSLFLEGLPLARMVDRRLSVDIELFSRGGLRILDKIEEVNYDVLTRRPVISKTDRVLLLASAIARGVFQKAA